MRIYKAYIVAISTSCNRFFSFRFYWVFAVFYFGKWKLQLLVAKKPVVVQFFHRFFLVAATELRNTIEKYHVIETFACNFLCSRDPFAMSCTPLSLAGTSQPSTLSTPTVASSSATNIWLDETLVGPFVGLKGVMELVSLQHLIHGYINILNSY